MFGFLEFLIEEFGDSIVDAVSGFFESGSDAVAAGAEALSDPGAGIGAEAVSESTGSGFSGYGSDSYTEWDGGIAGDRFDPKPPLGPYLQ